MRVVLLSFIYVDIVPDNGTPFGVPFNVKPSVRATQVLSMALIVITAKDVIRLIKEVSMLWYTSNQWVHVASCNAIDETFIPSV